MNERWTKLRERWSAWLVDSPRTLALFRVAVGGVVLYMHSLYSAARGVAEMDPAVWTVPIGLEWARVVPVSPALVDAAYVVLVLSAISGLVGFRARTAFAISTAAQLYAWGIAELAGNVFHYHHLVWFSALLAASPCGDAWSVDAWLRKRRGLAVPPAAAVYGIPIRAAWILIACLYFFPGVHKLATSGLAWIFSDNLKLHLWAKWAQMDGFEPLVRIDRADWLVQAGAFATVLFELSFPFLVVFRRTRLVAVMAAFGFHQATSYFMNLHFPALWLCFPVFFGGIVSWWEKRYAKDDGAPLARSLRPPATVSAILLAGAISFGVAGESDAWPFACYPKYHRLAPDRLPALEVTVLSGGLEQRVPDEAMFPSGRTQRYWAFVWSLMGSHETARASPERFDAFWDRVKHEPRIDELAREARVVRFYRVYVSTDPDLRDAPPLERELLYERAP